MVNSHITSSNPKNDLKAFAKGKDAWASTMKKSSQNVKDIGKTSQNKK
jgi:hypothetical protein